LIEPPFSIRIWLYEVLSLPLDANLTPPVIFRLRLARSRGRAVPTGHSRNSGIVSVACSVQAENIMHCSMRLSPCSGGISALCWWPIAKSRGRSGS